MQNKSKKLGTIKNLDRFPLPLLAKPSACSGEKSRNLSCWCGGSNCGRRPLDGAAGTTRRTWVGRGQTLADRWQTSVMELAGRQQDGAAAHQGPGEGSGVRAWLELHLPAAGLEHPDSCDNSLGQQGANGNVASISIKVTFATKFPYPCLSLI